LRHGAVLPLQGPLLTVLLLLVLSPVVVRAHLRNNGAGTEGNRHGGDAHDGVACHVQGSPGTDGSRSLGIRPPSHERRHNPPGPGLCAADDTLNPQLFWPTLPVCHQRGHVGRGAGAASGGRNAPTISARPIGSAGSSSSAIVRAVS